MFKFRRPRKSYYTNSYYRKPKRSPQISLWWLILAIPILIILLELLAQVFINLPGKKSTLAGESALVHAYRLQFLTENGQPIDGLVNQGQLVARRNSPTAYQLVGNQENQFWQINQQGFRDKEPLPLAKPKNEIRIFILGGSTAFGQGTQNNEETISHQLEVRLQQRVAQQKQSPQKYRPDVFPFFKPSREKLFKLPPKIRPGQYRTINAAVPGYASGNQLAQLALEILPYQPDLIVVLDGYTDLMLPSSQAQTDIPKIDTFLADAPAHFRTYLSQSANQWVQGTALARTLNSLVFKSKPNFTEQALAVNLNGKSLGQSLPKNEEELKQRIARYRKNHERIIRLCAQAGIPIIIAIQPEITGRSPDLLSPEEKSLRDKLGKEYLEKIPKAYSQFVQVNRQLAKTFPNNVKLLNLYNLDSNFPKPAFLDPIHLTKGANLALAEKLYQSITSWEKIQIIPKNFILKSDSN